MHKIINANGRELGIVERPYYIKLAANGSFAPCGEKDAQGIALDGTAYQLFGAASMGEGCETVIVKEVDGGKELNATNAVASIALVTLAEAGQIDDVTAGEHQELFSFWAYPVAYKAGQIRRYTDGKLYRCLQDHTSQTDWSPDVSPSLWVRIADPAEEWPEWSQPVGAADAYALGAKVSHNDKRWISDVDNNVWEPGVYGWTEEDAE